MGFPVSASPLFGGRPGASVVLQLLMSGGVSHFSFIHQELERSMVKRSVPVHTDVQKAQMKRDDHAVNAIVGWLEQGWNKPEVNGEPAPSDHCGL